jgi:hypothetical protein
VLRQRRQRLGDGGGVGVEEGRRGRLVSRSRDCAVGQVVAALGLLLRVVAGEVLYGGVDVALDGGVVGCGGALGDVGQLAERRAGEQQDQGGGDGGALRGA